MISLLKAAQYHRVATLAFRLLLFTSTIMLGGALFGPKTVPHDFLLGAAFGVLAVTTSLSFGTTVRFSEAEHPSDVDHLPVT